MIRPSKLFIEQPHGLLVTLLLAALMTSTFGRELFPQTRYLIWTSFFRKYLKIDVLRSRHLTQVFGLYRNKSGNISCSGPELVLLFL